MTKSSTLIDLLKAGAAGDAALAAPGRPALTYGGLRALAERTINRLNALGIGRNHRVAIVLPNGPEMAAAFVASRFHGDAQQLTAAPDKVVMCQITRAALT